MRSEVRLESRVMAMDITARLALEAEELYSGTAVVLPQMLVVFVSDIEVSLAVAVALSKS